MSTPSAEVIERPLEERLTPDSDLHKLLLRGLNDRADAAEAHVRQRHPDWKAADEHLRGYIDLRQGVKQADKSEDRSKREMPWGRTIEVPITYVVAWVTAMLETQALDRPPEVEGEGGPEEMAGARLLEASLQYDLDQTRHLLNLFQGVYDCKRYGVTVWGLNWTEEMGIIRERRAAGGMPGPGAPSWLRNAGSFAVERYGLRRQYNRAEVYDPYMILPDPQVPLAEHQRGEFFGHAFYRSFIDLWALRKRMDGTGVYFNLEECRRMGAPRGDDASGRQTTGSFDTGTLPGDVANPGVIKGRHMQWRLVPRWYGLGESEDPETWWFTTVAEGEGQGRVIVRAHRSDYEHGEFTYHVGQDHPDLHAPWTPGSAELIDGMSRLANFLANSHVMNQMMALYNMVIADTELVDEVDLRHPGPGRIVRLTAEGERLVKLGHPIGRFLQQMQTMDVSSPNMGTVQNLFGWAQRMFGANDTMQGLPTPDKRTLGEIQMGTGSATQRILMGAKLLDNQLLRGMFEQMILNRQQFTSVAQWCRVAGDLAKQVGADRVFVRPEDLYGRYRYRVISPTMPSDPAAQAETWINFLKVAGTVPGGMETPDGRRLSVPMVLEQIAHGYGINYVDGFYVKVVPDEMLAAKVQAGDSVPLPPAANAMLLPGMRPPSLAAGAAMGAGR
jgi:hypothetical protein